MKEKFTQSLFLITVFTFHLVIWISTSAQEVSVAQVIPKENQRIKIDINKDVVNAFTPLELPEWQPAKDNPVNPYEVIIYNLNTKTIRTEEIDPAHFARLSIERVELEPNAANRGTNSFSELTQVMNPEDDPWRMSGRVITKKGDDYHAASGILVDPKFVMISAHQVYFHENGTGFVDEISFYPGYSAANNTPFGSGMPTDYDVSEVVVFSQWVNNQDYDYDIALVKLQRPVGAITGYCSLMLADDSFFIDNIFDNPGYPNEEGTIYEGNQNMYNHYGSFDNTIGEYLLEINKQSFKGQSGSGIFASNNAYGVLSHRTSNQSKTRFTRLTDISKAAFEFRIGDYTPDAFDLMPLDVYIGPEYNPEILVGEQFEDFSFLVHNYSSQSWSGDLAIHIYITPHMLYEPSHLVIMTTYWNGTLGPKESARIAPLDMPSIPSNINIDLPTTYFAGVKLEIEDANIENNKIIYIYDYSEFTLIPSQPFYTLSDGSVNPVSGNTNDSYTFSVTYTSSTDIPPYPDFVRVHGIGWSYDLQQGDGGWMDGVTYEISTDGFNAGSYAFYFEASVADELIRFPEEDNSFLSFTVSPYAEGWDANVTSLTANRYYFSGSTNITGYGSIRNDSDPGNHYTDLPIKFEMFDPTGTLIHESGHVIPYLAVGETFNIQTPSIPISSAAPNGVYQLRLTAIPLLDGNSINNSRSINIIKGSSANAEHFHITNDNWFVNLQMNQSYTFANSTFTFKGVTTSGDAWIRDQNNNNYLIDLYDFEEFDGGNIVIIFAMHVSTTDAYFHFGIRDPSKITFEEVAISGFPGEQVTFQSHTNAPNAFTLASNFYADPQNISSWHNNQMTELTNNNRSRKDFFTIPASASTGSKVFYFLSGFNSVNQYIMSRLQINVLQPIPEITSLSNYLFSANDEITINGTNFGNSAGQVKFNELSGTVTAWSNTSITCIVPQGVGAGALTVINAGGTSNAVTYQVNVNVTLMADPFEGGTVSGEGTFVSGSQVDIIAATNPGWQFVNWIEGDEFISGNSAYTFIAERDITLTAVFYEGTLPVVSTTPAYDITENEAFAGGVVINDGGLDITSRGVVWSTASNPTLENNEGSTQDGSGPGLFTSHLTGLSPETTYYVRAYASNSLGTTYGEEFQFSTLDDTISQINFVFGQGYTWFSVNVDPGSMGLNDLFTELDPCYDDRVIGQTSFALYTGSMWAGTLNQLALDRMYRMRLCSQQSITLTGEPAPLEPIELNAGYTWLGYVPQECMPINEALANMEPAPSYDDRMIGQNSFALYTGTQWIGTLTTLCPGEGYVIRLANPVTLNWPEDDNGEEFNCGTSTVTFTYKGEDVTYGTVVGANNKCWLDRNLGATQVATSSTDANSYGDLFQWGRGDDGHQNRTSGTTPTLSNGDVPGHGSFILAPNNPYDWRSPQNDDLWQGLSGTNNPCPAGYRLPTEAEWEAERQSWESSNAAGAFNSPLKLPVAGVRGSSNGSLGNVGSGGYYWSATVDGIRARRLTFNSSSADMGSNRRAYGFSVRCLKD